MMEGETETAGGAACNASAAGPGDGRGDGDGGGGAPERPAEWIGRWRRHCIAEAHEAEDERRAEDEARRQAAANKVNAPPGPPDQQQQQQQQQQPTSPTSPAAAATSANRPFADRLRAAAGSLACGNAMDEALTGAGSRWLDQFVGEAGAAGDPVQRLLAEELASLRVQLLELRCAVSAAKSSAELRLALGNLKTAVDCSCTLARTLASYRSSSSSRRSATVCIEAAPYVFRARRVDTGEGTRAAEEL
jgi:hypothetical protein